MNLNKNISKRLIFFALSFFSIMLKSLRYNSVRTHTKSLFRCQISSQINLDDKSIEKIHSIERNVYNHLITNCQLSYERSTYMLLSVSGGVDSMAMLHIMGSLKQLKFPRWQIDVVNFNHKAREESDYEVSILIIF